MGQIRSLAARALLAEAGYGPDRPLPPITYQYNTSEGHRQIAEALQQMWKQTLGVKVTLENQEWKVFTATVRQGDYDLARGSWIADYADMATFGSKRAAITADAGYWEIIAKAEAILQETRNIRALADEFRDDQRGTLSIATTHTQARTQAG